MHDYYPLPPPLPQHPCPFLAFFFLSFFNKVIVFYSLCSSSYFTCFFSSSLLSTSSSSSFSNHDIRVYNLHHGGASTFLVAFVTSLPSCSSLWLPRRRPWKQKSFPSRWSAMESDFHFRLLRILYLILLFLLIRNVLIFVINDEKFEKRIFFAPLLFSIFISN